MRMSRALLRRLDRLEAVVLPTGAPEPVYDLAPLRGLIALYGVPESFGDHPGKLDTAAVRKTITELMQHFAVRKADNMA
jgi:hypothetical protein